MKVSQRICFWSIFFVGVFPDLSFCQSPKLINKINCCPDKRFPDPRDFAVSKNGDFLASFGSAGNFLWDVKNAKKILSLDGHTLNTSGAFADEKLLVTISRDAVFLWDLVKLEKKEKSIFLDILDSRCNAVSLRHVAIATKNFSIELFQIDSLKKVASINLIDSSRGNIRFLRFNESGDRLLIGYEEMDRKNGPRELLLVMDVSNKKVITTIEDRPKIKTVGVSLIDIAISPDGKKVASIGGQGHVKVWSAESGKLEIEIGSTSIPFSGISPIRNRSVSFSSDGSRIFTVNMFSAFLIYQIESGMEIEKTDKMFEAIPLIRYGNGNRFFASSCAGEVSVWRMDKSK